MYLKKTLVIYIVDTATNFKNTKCIKRKSAEDKLKALIGWWFTVYTGLLEIISNGPEITFGSERFQNNAKYIVLNLCFSVIGSQNAIGKKKEILTHSTPVVEHLKIVTLLP